MTDFATNTTQDDQAPKARVSRLASAAAPALGGAANSLREAYGAFKDAAGQIIGETRTQLDRLTLDASERFQGAYGDVEAYVQLRPARAIGVAAGVGLLIGLLMRGRRQTVYLRDRA